MTNETPQQSLLTPRGLVAVCVLFMVACWGKFLLPAAMQYGVDYAERLVLVGMVVVFGGYRFQASALNARAVGLTVVTVVLALALFRVEQKADLLIPILGERTWGFEDIESDTFFVFDLTVGLVLVAVSEELVFRYQFMRAFPHDRVAQYGLSTALFAAIHAPQGVTGLVATGLIGLLLMALYRATRTLAAPIAAHYFVNLILFAGWLDVLSNPADWFVT
ncbi:MAG: CPBP family intramembrane metalloprotease [Alphaproteobacteria bacterium]|nr:CPBP family intramembrane metalloprotease [Alphaproteobacteria bacterium]